MNEPLPKGKTTMKSRLLVSAALAAVLTAAVAVGAPAKGKPPTTSAGCKPQISVIVKGTLAADAGSAPTALSVNVTGGNRFSHAYKAGGVPVSVAVTSTTKVHRGSSTTWADLKLGDRVNIQAHACKADLAAGKTPPLTATRVTASAAKS